MRIITYTKNRITTPPTTHINQLKTRIMESTINLFGIRFSKRGLIAVAIIALLFIYSFIYQAVANTPELMYHLSK